MESRNLREALEDPRALKLAYDQTLARARGLSEQTIAALNELLLKDRPPEAPNKPAEKPHN